MRAAMSQSALLRSALLLSAVFCLEGCGALSRVSQIGEQPTMTKLNDPTRAPGYQPVSMPVPDPSIPKPEFGSIWQPGARAFFKDQRAKRAGDTLTVSIAINDSATMNNQTQGNRGDSDAVSINNLFGLENTLDKFMNPASAVNTSNKHVSNGQAQIARSEQINLRVAAEVTQVLPNGNLVIVGRQELRVNFDVRELQLTGVVRPSDIDALDEITYDKIAEARISYGGHGQGYDLQQPRYGQQLLDIISPF
jgi:flagellar L-ring protein precursor FlgH